ncbi:MAG: T9SS type A sorting domain-containing protein [Bacteroidales bacterium]|nr:T9SS type A sorting domain-containing protein [Bacteroidales bacterium]
MHGLDVAALSFINNAVGGTGSPSGGQGYGGFGGGGGDGYADGGGGGGYSGGNEPGEPAGAYGGASYNDGTNQVNTAGANTGHGYVVITLLCDPLTVTATPGTTVCPNSDVTLTATSDNGGNITWTGGVTNAVPFNIAATTTFIATSDNVDDCPATITITVEDLLAPVPDVATLSDVTGECSATVATAPTATDACTGIITGTTSDPLTYTSTGTYNITWTYDDGNGNTSTQNQTVIVTDVEAPVADLAVLDDIIADCSVTVMYTPTATDACVGMVYGTTADPLFYDELGTYTITWTYDDGNGNTFTQEQLVIVDDNTPPIAMGQDVTLYLDENGYTYLSDYTIYFTATFSNQVWKYDGGNNVLYNNAAADYAGPVGIEYVPENGMLYWGGGNQTYVYYAPADGSYTQTAYFDNSNFGNEHHDLDIDYANNRYFFSSGEEGVWMADLDDTYTPTLVSDGNEAYETTGLEYNPQNGYLYMSSSYNYISRMFDDGSGVEVLYDNSDGVDGPRDVAIDTVNSRIFWVNKNSGNVMMGSLDGTYSATVLYGGITPTIYGLFYEPTNEELFWTTFTGSWGTFPNSNDTIWKASADGMGVPQAIISGDFGAIRGIYVIAPETETINAWSYDECSNISDVSYSITDFTCDNVGDNLVTMFVTDDYGNTSTYSSTVTVIDEYAPVPDVVVLPDVAGECFVDLSTYSVTATDNCGMIYGVADQTYFNMSGTYTVTWTYDDGTFMVTQTQTVIVTDETAPVADVAMLDDIVGECDATVTFTPTATDNCAGTINATTIDPLYYDMQGTYTITWIYDDGNGNSITQTQNVVVSDQTAPTISCISDIVVDADASNTYSVTGFAFDATGNDNCTVDMFYNDYSMTETLDGTVFMPGTYTITWTIEDEAGNMVECSYMLTVNPYVGLQTIDAINVSVFPNPTTGLVNVQNAKGYKLQVTDISGRILQTVNATSETTTVDLSQYANGMYFIQIVDNGVVSSVKVIKK